MKQVIVVRKDLNMRKGKLAAQVAHAAIEATLNNIHRTQVLDWLETGMSKIVVGCNSEEELLQLYSDVKSTNHIPCSLIKDAGKTEFKEPTFTCIAIGPDTEENVDEFTSHLKLL